MNAVTQKRAPLPVALRSARIVTGLILLSFVTTHLVNLILGMHSIALVEQARPYLTGLWTGPIGSVFLEFTLTIHFLLAMEAIYKRKTLRMSANDMVQFLAGLAIIPLLVPHVIGIGATREIMSDSSYDVILKFFWQQDPIAGLRQVLLLGIIWVHGCLGLFMWLRSKTWALRSLPWLYPLAVAIPVFALLGYVEAGREVLIAAKAAREAQAQVQAAEAPTTAQNNVVSGLDPVGVDTPADETTEQHQAPAAPLTPTQIVARSKLETSWVIRGAIALVVLVLLLRAIRVLRRRKAHIEVTYLNGPKLESKTGPSLLDIARLNDLPHAHICNGRGRCGTCRVRILEGAEYLPEPLQLEQDTLERLGCGPDVRLACQLHPVGGELKVERLLPPDYVLERKTKSPRGASQ
jgi:adenylate cyclase